MGLIERMFGRKATGEISVLTEAQVSSGTYELNTNRVDYKLARKLYRNTHDDYKLGAWAAKPVVNTAAGFMGAPRFRHAGQDEAVQAVLDEGINSWDAHFLRINRNTSRDGDCFARLGLVQNRFDKDDIQLDVQLIAPELVTPVHDPITGNMKECVIKWPVAPTSRDGSRVRSEPAYHIIEVLSPDGRELSIEGSAPPAVRQELEDRAQRESEDNSWGFVPIVHFRNAPEELSVYGMSDLEPIEPFMRAYHDTLLFAVQGAKTMARPKVQIGVDDVKGFLERNFSVQEIKDKRLRFADKEIFITQGTDKVDFVTGDTGLTGIVLLLEFLFYCIVDVSETPEFAFGTAVASSKASVSEQMPVLARNIRRRRGEQGEPAKEFAEMFLAMQSQIGMAKPETFRCEIEWEELTPKDDGETATTLSSLMTALLTGVEGGLVSQDAAIDFLGEFMPTMMPASTEGSETDEKQRIAAGRAFLDRLDAGDIPNPDEPPRLLPVPNEV